MDIKTFVIMSMRPTSSVCDSVRVGCGAPEFDIPKSVLEGHLEEGFTIEQISAMLSVSERYGLRSLNFSNISDHDLDGHIMQLSKEFSLMWRAKCKFYLVTMLRDCMIASACANQCNVCRRSGWLFIAVFEDFFQKYSSFMH